MIAIVLLAGEAPPHIERYDALGTSFKTDVLKLALDFNEMTYADEQDWESTMWAVFTAAAQVLDIPQSEIGGTLYQNVNGSWSLLLYDDVPGGAGHVLRLADRVPELLGLAYEIVDECSCSEDTCYCGCIANYYNQNKQDKLSRGAARKLPGSLMGK